MSRQIFDSMSAAEDAAPLLPSYISEETPSDSPPSYSSLPRRSSNPHRGAARFAPVPTPRESELRLHASSTKPVTSGPERSSRREAAATHRETSSPHATAATPGNAYGTPLQLEAGTTSRRRPHRTRFQSTYNKDTLESSALAVFALCCAAPTYSLLVQSLALSTFNPDTAPWAELKMSALILPAMLGGFLIAIFLFTPVLFLTLWVDGVKWTVPYVFVLANLPILIGTAILPSSALPEGFTIAHAAQLCLWGLVPPTMIAGAVACVGLVVGGFVACGVVC